jgi:hypothetical protein
MAAAGLAAAALLWPRRDPEVVEHLHADLPEGHPHRPIDDPAPTGRTRPFRHRHAFVINDLHTGWPR